MPKERVALTKFRIRAYRSCKDTVFSLKDQFTALIGPNGAGKTNVMNAVLLLSKTSNVQFRSYARENFTDKCEVTADFTVNDKIVHYRSIINYTQTEANKDQVVSANVKWNFKSITGKSVWYQDELLKISMSSGSNFIIRSGHRIYYRGIGGRVQAHPAKSIGRISKRELGYYEHIQNFLAGMKYYSASQFTNPSLSPTFFEIDEEKGERLSENIMTRRLPHTRFVYDLYSLSKSNKKSYDNFLSLVGSQGVKIIDGINWQSIDVPSATYEVQTGGKVINKTKNRIMIIPTMVIGPSKLSFNQLSEGTLRTLAMLFYIVTDESELLLLEEPEVCVHHGLLKSVLEVIRQYSKRKQIIISTHSEAVLDNIDPEQVLIVSKNNETGTIVRNLRSVMRTIEFKALKTYLMESGSLGEYWRLSGFDYA